jgi:hypothetical protein
MAARRAELIGNVSPPKHKRLLFVFGNWSDSYNEDERFGYTQRPRQALIVVISSRIASVLETEASASNTPGAPLIRKLVRKMILAEVGTERVLIAPSGPFICGNANSRTTTSG